MECEDELKRAVQWTYDYYQNVTDEYEETLYDFEQTYITNTDQPDYQFLYDIEEIIYSGLDDLEEAAQQSGQDLEDLYWDTIEKLDKSQDEAETEIENAETDVDNIMDSTETELEVYIENLNQIKWDLQEIELDTQEDIQMDIEDYYEDDEDSFGVAEFSSLNEFVNGLSSVDDFDTAPSYINEYEQAREIFYEEISEQDEVDS